MLAFVAVLYAKGGEAQPKPSDPAPDDIEL